MQCSIYFGSGLGNPATNPLANRKRRNAAGCNHRNIPIGVWPPMKRALKEEPDKRAAEYINGADLPLPVRELATAGFRPALSFRPGYSPAHLPNADPSCNDRDRPRV
jgi:hypothetical protein